MADITWKIEGEERTVVERNGRRYVLAEIWGSDVKVLKITDHGLVYTLTGDVERESESLTIHWSERSYPRYLVTVHFDIGLSTTYVLTCKGDNLFVDDISCSWPVNSEALDHKSTSFTTSLCGAERTILISDAGESAMTSIGAVPDINDAIFSSTMTCSIANIEMMKRAFSDVDIHELVGKSFSSLTRHPL